MTKEGKKPPLYMQKEDSIDLTELLQGEYPIKVGDAYYMLESYNLDIGQATQLTPNCHPFYKGPYTLSFSLKRIWFPEGATTETDRERN